MSARQRSQKPGDRRTMSDLEFRRAVDRIIDRNEKRVRAALAAREEGDPFVQVYIKRVVVKRHTRAAHWRTITVKPKAQRKAA
jgi:hypothetical protein